VADKSAGQVAYEAYVDHVGGFSVRDEPLPDWSSQRERLQDAWQAAAVAVINYSMPADL